MHLHNDPVNGSRRGAGGEWLVFGEEACGVCLEGGLGGGPVGPGPFVRSGIGSGRSEQVFRIPGAREVLAAPPGDRKKVWQVQRRKPPESQAIT